ncbi:nucleolar protein 14 [Angomonas deanei]|nr:hypothetical protein AGDE_08306 [Angomonas deanei]EPY35336.1 nucleolar protein 14 [Angomonas deanei]|eukprot:EPY33392.1 hypothetical protein AGDE_08306 [Angomonas deanei]
MPPSRAVFNSKLAQRTQRKNVANQAKESGNRFTQRQSHFELRQEESQVKRFMQPDRSNSTAEKGSTDFLFSSEAPVSTARTPKAAKPMSTRSGVFGISSGAPSGASRSARRSSKFQLEERTPLAGGEAGIGGGLLGALRRPRDENEYNTEEEGVPTKMTKQDRFREVIHNSRSQRAADQREREVREEQTLELDEEFKTLRHLLPTRDKDQEERQAFLKSNTPEVRALLRDHRKKNPTAKILTIRSSGKSTVTVNDTPSEATKTSKKKISFLDPSQQELLNLVRSGTIVSAEEKEMTEKETEAEEEDDFDNLMNSMRVDPRRAHATDRLLSEEEILLQEAQQAVLEADRQELPDLGLRGRDMIQRSKGEWVQRGGDDAYHMDDEDMADDNVDIPSSYEGESEDDDEMEDEKADEEEGSLPGAEAVTGTAVLDNLLAQLEKIAKTTIEDDDAASRKRRSSDIHKIVLQIYVYAQQHLLDVSNTFRAVLIEAEKQFLRSNRKALDRPLLLYLYVISKVFPTSDYRHEVMTPFYIFLSSTIAQMKIESLESAHCYLVLASLLAQSLVSGQGRFAAEVVVAPFNILALQLPRSVLEPARYQGVRVPFPLADRCEKDLLRTSGKGTTAGSAVDLLSTSPSEEGLLLAAYRLLTVLAETYSSIAAFPSVFAEPLASLDALLQEAGWSPSEAVRQAHVQLQRTVSAEVSAVEKFRTPLAMRSFRPRPLRQFEPLLNERPESAVRNEIKLLKRTVREDKKRVMRHLTAEATVQRRAREKESAATDEIREKRYRQVMGQLQSQQHIMNTVDSIMDKAKSKKKKSISGLPSEDS